MPNRKQEIPKDGGKKVRVLSIPAIRDRVVQGALKLILEPTFEADFQPGLFGYRAGNYFAGGNAGRCFSHVRCWVVKAVRRHLARNSKRSGFGWKRWSTRWLYQCLGLFDACRVSYNQPQQKALPA